MKGIIILEGPDASGKSTLAKDIKKINYGNKTSIIHMKYKFKNKIDKYYLAAFLKTLKLCREELVILDRFHLSEKFYAKVYRGGSKWENVMDLYDDIFKIYNIFIILCLPLSIEQGKNWHNQAKIKRQEMYENIDEIIPYYIKYYNDNKKNNNIILYNYETNKFIYKDTIYNDLADIMGVIKYE